MYYIANSGDHAGDIKLEGTYGRNMRDEDSLKKAVIRIDASRACRENGAIGNGDLKLRAWK